jgi:succinate dehydrogenase/fumarate reductase-like Fe-S protein
MADNYYNVKILRYDPTEKNPPKFVTYGVPYRKGYSILNVINYIYENIDSSLSFYYSCRIGKCNGCIMKVNGIPTRTCTTPAKKNMTIEPIENHEILKDLVVKL